MIGKFAALLALSVAVITPTAGAAAQQPPKQVTASPTATLYRVDEGMFDIRRGQSLDLTDRKVLLSFPASSTPIDATKKSIWLALLGHEFIVSPGQRFDLKNNSILKRETFADKTECYFDLIDVAVPKGAPPVATLRFECN